jgi:hydroxyacylglutathione hydrolase
MVIGMFIARVKAEGLAVNSYLIGSGNEAVVIDPLRDTEAYVRIADEQCVKIKLILETHRHEDFALGSVELRSQTGARICRSGRMDVKYCDVKLNDGGELWFGNALIRAIETPGHTADSMTYLLYEAARPGIALAAFCGDVLFAGSCGRIDFCGESRKAECATDLYNSIHDRLLPAGDQAILYPAHGSGSVCGSGISDRDDGTIGFERLTNPWLAMDLDRFVRAKAAEKLEYAPYFGRMEHWNLNGPLPVLKRRLPEPLDPASLKRSLKSETAVLVDTRLPQAYAGGHIPGSYNIWADGMTLHPGWLFDGNTKFYLVPERPEDVPEIDRYLRRIGYEGVAGYLCSGFAAWQNLGGPIERNGVLTVDELKDRLDSGTIHLVDVREPSEWDMGIIPGADLRFLGRLTGDLPQVSRDSPVAVMCNTGLRAGIGTSILLKAGFTDVYTVPGGMTAWKNKGHPVEKHS